MDYRYLSAFIYVAENLSFSSAAKKLNISTAAVSRQIKLFEQSLGKQLFIRSPQQVALTEHGFEIYKLTLRFKESTDIYLGNENAATIRIGVITPILNSFLINCINKYYKNSTINFDIKSMAPSLITQELNEGKLDIGLYNKNIQSELLTSLKLLPEQPVLISKEKISLKELSEKRWIICEDKDYLINFASKKRMAISKRLLKVNSPTAQIKFVQQGYGVAIVSSLIIPHNSKLQKLSIHDFQNEFFYFVTSNTEYLSEHIVQFRKNLQSYLKSNFINSTV